LKRPEDARLTGPPPSRGLFEVDAMSTQRATRLPTANEIAARAHELFLAGGRRVAMIPHYWLTAERELLGRAVERHGESSPPVARPTHRRRCR